MVLMHRPSPSFWVLALLLVACDDGDATPESPQEESLRSQPTGSVEDAGHAAVDAARAAPDAADTRCFTPTENRDLATFGSNRGCACEETTITRAGFCVWDDTTPDDFKPFMCYRGHWITGADGPCFPPAVISSADCQRRGGEELGDVTNTNLRAPDAMPCPEGRQFLGVVTLEDHSAACCKRP
jgi:hypothetical protein